MTINEFKIEMARLEDTFPKMFSSKSRVKLFYEAVRELDHRWFKKHVDLAILKFDSKYDFAERAYSELAARRQIERTHAALELSDLKLREVTEDGLRNVLESMGVNSLLEAISLKKCDTI